MKTGYIGMKLSAGEVVLTKSGRPTTPFPRLALDSERKITNTLKRVEAWLRDNAIAEAAARRDQFNQRNFASETQLPMPQASKDGMELYLFDT